MEFEPTPTDTVPMKTAFRILTVGVTLLVASATLWGVLGFGDCAGWKGTGTCPRTPFWDWQIFQIAFFGFVPLVLAIRIRRGRVVRALIEGGVVAALVATLVVVATAS